MLRLIGFYDYTVILTYLSLISSMLGMVLAFHGNFTAAIFCLGFSGIFDAFDGRVARTKEDRTEDEKNFGIQLDSLCDVICFGLFPALLCYMLGVRGVLGLSLAAFYCICAVIRLAFFNVLEANRQKSEEGCNKTYRGLPVTSISAILPVVFWTQHLMSETVFMVVLHLLLAVIGLLFILDFPLRKPGLKGIVAVICSAAIIVGAIFLYTKNTTRGVDETILAAETGIEAGYEAKNP